MSYATLDGVINQTLNGLEEPNPQRKYAQFLGYANKWFNENNMAGARPRTVQLDVSPDRTAILPEDYVDFLTVGIVVDGLIRNLAYNPKLDIADVEPFVEPPSLDMEVDTRWPRWEYPGLGHAGPVYGYGYGEYRNDFVIDTAERLLKLGSVFHPDTPLLLSYVSNTRVPGQATPIHEYEQSQLDYFLRWQYTLAKRDFTAAREFERLYYNERRKATSARSTFGYAELRNILASNYSQLPRG